MDSGNKRLKTPNSGGWSDLSHDLIVSTFKRLSFTDFNRAKIVCSNWYHSSKQSFPMKTKSPWLMLFPDKDDSCMLYNLVEDKVYRTERDFLGIRFLASSGKWFLVLDSLSNLYIMDIFSGNKIDLPPLESLQSRRCSLERVGDKKFKWNRSNQSSYAQNTDDLKGLLWVDEKSIDFVVVWFTSCNLAFCKKGDDHCSDIPIDSGLSWQFRGVDHAVLCGYLLYIVSDLCLIRLIDFSSRSHMGYVDLTLSRPIRFLYRLGYRAEDRIAVRISGEILLVEKNQDIFSPVEVNSLGDEAMFEVNSLGDEALFLDLSMTVPLNDSLGLEPNSIYITHPNRICPWESKTLDICVYNTATKTFIRFHRLSDMNLKDAR